MTGGPAQPCVFLYRWRLAVGQEDAFIVAWSEATVALHGAGSLGSRLHRGCDGWWYGYAQWPDLATRDAAFAAGLVPESTSAMAAAAVESLPPVRLDPVVDLLQPLAPPPRNS